MSAYRRDFDKTKCMPFLIKDDKILKKYNEIWEKVTTIIYKEFSGNPVYNEKFIKTKIKVYNKKIHTNFRGNKTPNESLECVRLFTLSSLPKRTQILSSSIFRGM